MPSLRIAAFLWPRLRSSSTTIPERWCGHAQYAIAHTSSGTSERRLRSWCGIETAPGIWTRIQSDCGRASMMIIFCFAASARSTCAADTNFCWRLGGERERRVLALGVDDERLLAGRRRQRLELRRRLAGGIADERDDVVHVLGRQLVDERLHLRLRATGDHRLVDERVGRDDEELRV